MKKIVAVVGSPNVEKSNTFAMIEDFLKMVKEYAPSVEYEIISLGNKKIEMCRGCWACTKLGHCIIEDDIEMIKQKLLSCDFLIVGSPVYVHQVSAQTKVFFDRMFIWLHTVKLIGKPALTAVTTAGSGIKSTEKYLDDMMSIMGMINQGHLRGIAYQPGIFPKREHYKESHRNLAKKVASILEGKIKVKPTLKNSFFFWAMKSKAKYNPEALSYEHKYWTEKGWMHLSFKKAMSLESKR